MLGSLVRMYVLPLQNRRRKVQPTLAGLLSRGVINPLPSSYCLDSGSHLFRGTSSRLIVAGTNCGRLAGNDGQRLGHILCRRHLYAERRPSTCEGARTHAD